MEALIPDIAPLVLLSIAATVFLANILRAFTGFGFALAALPIFSLVLSPTTSVSLIVLLALAISLQSLNSYRRDIPTKDMTGMIVASAIGTLAGAYLLLLFSPQVFRLAIGIMVMLACFLLLKYKPAPHRAGGALSVGAGLISGLLNGALSIPGPPVIIYSMSVYEKARVARAFLLGFFLFSAIFGLVAYGINGLIGQLELTLFVICYPAMMLGEKVGTSLFEKYGDASHRKIAIAALFAIGLSVAAAAIF